MHTIGHKHDIIYYGIGLMMLGIDDCDRCIDDCDRCIDDFDRCRLFYV
jgi:hypothetical protein